MTKDTDFDFWKNFRFNLRLLRTANEISGQKLSNKLGMSDKRIDNFEQSHVPKVEELFQIAKFFQVDVNDLIHKRIKINFE